MNQPLTMPNLVAVPSWHHHSAAIDGLCKCTGFPLPGSTLTLSYRAGESFMELLNLDATVTEFRHGLKDSSGRIIVRDMEQTIQVLAQRYADLLQRFVKARAVVILPHQNYVITARASTKARS